MTEERKSKIEKMMPVLITGFVVGVAGAMGRDLFNSTWADIGLKLAVMAALAGTVAWVAQMGVRAYLRRS